MAANVQKQVQCLQFAATTSSGATPIFLGGIKKVMLRTLSQDVYVDVDQPIATTTSYRISSNNTADTIIELEMGLMSNLYLQAVTGTTTVYLILICG
jgi:hypothetical protein